jgi:5-methyltetrahydrofolate--homocysteine methyltransferase
MVDLKQIAEKVIEGDSSNVAALVKTALAKGINPQKILDEGLGAGMAVVGQRFKADEMFIPEVLTSANAMVEGTGILESAFASSGGKTLATVVLGTVKGDIHDVGKNIVAIMLKAAGFKALDLGVDVPAEKFVEVVKAGEVSLVGMSALLTTTAPYMGTVIQALKEANVRDKVKVIVGGAILTPAFAQQIGADAYAPDGIAAAEKVKDLLA